MSEAQAVAIAVRERPAPQPVRDRQRPVARPEAPQHWPNGSAVYAPGAASPRLGRRDEERAGFLGRTVQLADGRWHVWRWTFAGYVLVGTAADHLGAMALLPAPKRG